MEPDTLDNANRLMEYRNAYRLLKYADLAEYLQVSQEFLRHAVMKKSIPFIKIGRSVRFDPTEIDQWLKTIIIKPEVTQ